MNSRRKNSLTASKVMGPKDGRVMPPLILWMLGVPGFVVVLLWLFVFRGH